MAKINTVLGPIDPESLGLTLPHEHIIAAYPGWECDPLARQYNQEKIVNSCLKNIEPIKQYGVKTIIDATPVDLSRNVDVMKDISEKLQLHIVCATGRYTEAEGKWIYFKRRQTGIKPGVIKVATGLSRIAPCEETTLRAAAQASRETGIPITTHTEDGTMGPEQADLLIGEGVKPQKITIGHMCGNASRDYQLDVLKRGVYIAFDRFGIEMKMTDKTRVATLLGLLQKGYANRIMISHDCIAAVYGRGGRMPMEEAIKFKNWSFTNIFTNILPALKTAGVSDEQIKTMMVENPRRFLSGT
jgi:phosphotriesterase-related protein